MKNPGFTALLAGILLIGCSGNRGNYELKGKVMDEKTNIPIPNIRIIVHGLVQSEKGLTRSYAGEFCADSSGFFAYSLGKRRNIYLYEFCIVGDSSYAFLNKTLGMTELNRNGKFLSFYLSKLTDFTIAIERKNKTPDDETLYVKWSSNGIDGKKLYPYTIKNYGIMDYGNSSIRQLKWTGGDIKSAIKTKVFADKETIVILELYKNLKVKEFRDTIFCKRDVFNYVYFNY
jgi:hypothetical protein